MTPEDVIKIAAYGGFEIDSERSAHVATEYSALWPLLELLNQTDAGTAEPATRFIPPGLLRDANEHGRRG